MPDKKSPARTSADLRFGKMQRTTEEARATIESQVNAQRTKTAGLKEQRLTKEALDRAAAENAKPKRRSKSKSPGA